MNRRIPTLLHASALIESGKLAQGLDVIEEAIAVGDLDAAGSGGSVSAPARVMMQKSIHQPAQRLQSAQNAKDDQQKANIKGQCDANLEHSGSFWGGGAILPSMLLKFLLWVFLPKSNGVLQGGKMVMNAPDQSRLL